VTILPHFFGYVKIQKKNSEKQHLLEKNKNLWKCIEFQFENRIDFKGFLIYSELTLYLLKPIYTNVYVFINIMNIKYLQYLVRVSLMSYGILPEWNQVPAANFGPGSHE